MRDARDGVLVSARTSLEDELPYAVEACPREGGDMLQRGALRRPRDREGRLDRGARGAAGSSLPSTRLPSRRRGIEGRILLRQRPRLREDMLQRGARRDACRSLYWRSTAQTPHGASIAATRRGTGPTQVLEAQGAIGRSRRAGPRQQHYPSYARATMRGTGGGPAAKRIEPRGSRVNFLISTLLPAVVILGLALWPVPRGSLAWERITAGFGWLAGLSLATWLLARLVVSDAARIEWLWQLWLYAMFTALGRDYERLLVRRRQARRLRGTAEGGSEGDS